MIKLDVEKLNMIKKNFAIKLLLKILDKAKN